jgi:hypothetical protein
MYSPNLHIETSEPGTIEFSSADGVSTNAQLSAALAKAKSPTRAIDAYHDFEIGTSKAPSVTPAATQVSTPTVAHTDSTKAGCDLHALHAGRDPWADIREHCTKEIEELDQTTRQVFRLRHEYNRRGYAPGSAQRMIQDLEKSISPGLTPDQLDTLANEIARLKAISQPVCASAAVTVNTALDAAKAAFSAVINKAVAFTEAKHTESVNAEDAFFGTYGLPRMETEISARWNRARADLLARAEYIKPSERLGNDQHTWTLDPHSMLSPLVPHVDMTVGA